jgi:hypothetical protein
MQTVKTIISELITDRVVQAGTGTSTISFAGAIGVEHHRAALATLADVQPWIAFFAALFGGLSAFATFVYVCLKIARMLRNPRSAE